MGYDRIRLGPGRRCGCFAAEKVTIPDVNGRIYRKSPPSDTTQSPTRVKKVLLTIGSDNKYSFSHLKVTVRTTRGRVLLSSEPSLG